MREGKVFASLSSGLLARKGQARPAMRPQGFAPRLGQQDDLGWNDMGYDVPRVPVPVEALDAPTVPSMAPVVELPQVIRQQEEIAREFGARAEPTPAPTVVQPTHEEPEAIEPEPASKAQPASQLAAEPAPLAEAPKPRRSRRAAPRPVSTILPRTHKAAFTLRLDTDRHLLLRLACAVQHRSAQQIVVEALDRLLADLPDVARLASSLPKQD